MILKRAILLLTCVFAAGAALAQEQGIVRKGLSKTDHATLAMLRVAGKKQATLLVVTPRDSTAEIEKALKEKGCEIKEVATEIGYIRCIAPIDQLEGMTKLPGIESSAISTTQLSTVYSVPLPAAADTREQVTTPSTASAPNRYMSQDNPFTATGAMQALAFREAHPSFDGRGVAVGTLEGQVDLLTPEIKWAKDINGKTVPKILDWTVTGSWDSSEPSMPDWMYASALSGSTWTKVKRPFSIVPTEKPQEIRKGVVRFRDAEYLLPNESSDADWRMGVFDSKTLEPPFGPLDTNLDGVTDDSDNYTILLDNRGKRVWVDLNHNKDFRDDTPLRDFSVAREYGVFGKDNPATPLRESRTFFVHLEPDRTEVWLDISMEDHGDMVASVLAGSRFLGSEADGIAPGAQIVLHNMCQGFTHTYIEVLLRAFRDRRTDVITFSGGDDIRPTDGSHIIDLLTSRMIAVYHKPIFVAADNSGPIMGMLNSPSVSPAAFSVGAYTPTEAWKANFGVTPTAKETLAPYSATGPTDNGELKPDFLGVTGTLATTPGFDKGYLGQKHYYTPPAGYMVSGGTSAATPTAAGAGALLISAAKQTGIPYDVARLRAAIVSTAKFLPGVEARTQGNGLIQVADAWGALQKLRSPTWRPAMIVSEAPVKTTTSHRLSPPDRGPGIFEREGWSFGTSGTREVAFTRKSGSPKPVSYKLEWKGDTDVFTSPGELTLPLNQTVRLPVRISPKGTGAFSAILSLIDRDTALVAYQTLNTVVVPFALNASNGYRQVVSGKAPRPGNADVFVAVPEDAQAFQVSAKLKGCNGALEVADPDANYPVRIAGAVPHDENVFEPVKEGEVQRSFDDPRPGVWQVSVANGGDAMNYDEKSSDHVQPCEFTLTATALGVSIDSAAKSLKPGEKYPVQVFNRLAALEGRIESTALGSARVEKTKLDSEFQQVVYELDVPKGTKKIEAVIGGTSDPAADVDLYLFDATGDVPFLAAFSVRDGSKKHAEVLDPKPGRWKVVVDPYRLPHGPVEVDYRDTFYHDAFGKIEVAANRPEAGTSQPDNVKTGSGWFGVDVQARPEGRRRLVGAINAVNDNVYVTIVDPDAKVPEPNPLEMPKPVPTKKIPIPIQTLIVPVE